MTLALAASLATPPARASASPSASASPAATAPASSVPSVSSEPGDTNGCVVCHGLPQIVDTPSGDRPGLLVTTDRIQASVHATLACTDCHNPLAATGHPVMDRAVGSCATCHATEQRAWAAGAHGRASDVGPSPTCVMCHSAHDVVPAKDPAFRLGLSERCAQCHSDIDQYPFTSNALGMETHLGRLDIATCDDCHAAHEVLPPGDPRSPLSLTDRLATCRSCHTGAPDSFAEIQIHVASGPLPADPRLRLATLWMLVILIVTFAFFGWLTALGIRHEWRRARAPDAEGA